MARNVTSVILSLAVAMVLSSAPSSGQDGPAPRIPIAVADFDYVDTSGEVRNQEAEHAARLRAFVDALRAALAQDARYQVVALECPEPPCTAGRLAATELIERARAAGAKLLLYGGIQKMSSLIQNGKAQVVDLQADRLLFDRLISFRGDTDDSWAHAQRFLLRELKNANLLSQ